MSGGKAQPHVVIIGGGFGGLAAAYELTRRGMRVSVLERDEEVGGLAGSFPVDGARLEKFYHHWFTNDRHIMGLVAELDAAGEVLHRATRTGMYYANSFFRLSSPLDLLRFKPLALIDRIRLGLLALRARRIVEWRSLEGLTAAEWLRDMAGDEVFRVVWEPLLHGKFGSFAPEVSAVWFWNKLALRGGSRGKGGAEQLAYYRGGFAALADRLVSKIEASGGSVLTRTPAQALRVDAGRAVGVQVPGRLMPADAVIATPALPIIADLLQAHSPPEELARLRRVRYLANLCLVLQLDRSLSDTYWLNVNDPAFPFVGVIEHTNFEPPESYGGRHIVYLSKYLPADAPMYTMPDEELLRFTVPHLRRMFPAFQAAWIKDCHVWRAPYAQPLIERHYSRLIPPHTTSLPNVYVATMAQVYPEDRGTNYAIREGRRVAARVAEALA